MSEEHKHSKISTHVKSQIPSHLRKNRPLFVELMEAYYEYLEQTDESIGEGKAVERAKNLRNYNDIDKTFAEILVRYYKQFLSFIPRSAANDKILLLKHIKDFYRAKGTEKSYKFLIRLLSRGDNDAEFYYPKSDILKASDSTWYIQKTLRVLYLKIDGVNIEESEIADFYKFNGLLIEGADSGATAIVDKAAHFYEGGFVIDELTLSSIDGTFAPGEIISATYVDSDGIESTLTATINPGVVSGIQVSARGYGYSIGDNVVIEPALNSPGTGAVAQVSDITTGSVNTVVVLYGGSGYRANDELLFFSGSGSGAEAIISSVNDDGVQHPNVYTVDVSTISLEANTQIGNAVYSNLNSSNANVAIIDAVSTFLYANTGPAAFVTVVNEGSEYTSIPSISVIGNTRIQALGILGRMNVVHGGLNYNVGDSLVFTNVLGGHGIAASANVVTVNASGAILNVAYQEVTGFPKGGVGYDNDFLPRITVNSAIGTGANVVVDSLIGFGANVIPSLTTIGGILAIEIVSGGYGYNTAPNINLTMSGSGTARANANVQLGLYSYPGRYITDKGHLSAHNFLQDRDYYQNYSYVVRVDESLERYKKALEELVHPAGTKMFSEYLLISDNINVASNLQNVTANSTGFYSPNVIYFDGASSFGTNNESLARDSAGRTGLLSMWFYSETLPPANERIHMMTFGSANYGYMAMTNTGFANSGSGITLAFALPNTNEDGVSVELLSDSNTHPIEANTFYHVLCAWPISGTTKAAMYLNDVDVLANTTITSYPRRFTKKNCVIGGSETGQMFKGAMAEILIANTWLDLSVESNRRLFSNNLLPINLDTNILANTSVIPILYLKNPAATANLNLAGNSNSLSVITGTITDANVSIFEY